MNQEKINKQIFTRLERLERAAFDGAKQKPKVAKPHGFKGATGGIRFLVSRGFFDNRRSFAEIREGLESHGYHYSNQAVQTPLNNLSKSGGPLVGLKKSGKKIYAKRK